MRQDIAQKQSVSVFAALPLIAKSRHCLFRQMRTQCSTSARRLAPGEFVGTPDLQVAFPSGAVSFIGQQTFVDHHQHSDTHFVLIVEGCYRTGASRTEGRVGRGCVLLNPPGTSHDDQFEGPGKLVTFSLSGRLIHDFGGWDERAFGASRALDGASPAGLLRAIAHEASAVDEVSDLEIEGLGYELMASVVTSTDQDRSAPRWLTRVRAIIEDRLTGPPTVAELAREAGVHPVHLTRTFRKFLGQTPGSVVRRARAKRAARMLARSREPICNVAQDCGFSDQAAFTKAFVRATSVSPGAFRRRWSC